MLRYFANLLLVFICVDGSFIPNRLDEPKCNNIYSKFDWEDKLLEKTIKADIKLDQHITNLDKTVSEIKALKNAFGELKRITARQYDELEELQEWKRQFSSLMSKLQRTTYTRWGRTTCPGNGSEPVYDGFAGGSYYDHRGGASSMLCLPKDPDWDAGKTSDKLDDHVGLIYGAEYEDGNGRSDQLLGGGHYNRDVPCVVCGVAKRSTVIMVPGRSKCHQGWTLEYAGYIMSGPNDFAGATDYNCVDKDPENLPDGTSNENGRLLFFVEARCGSLKCPPYVNGREFQCAVCTK